MWKYILKRILIAVPTLFGITVITFCLIHLAPGDPDALGTSAAGAGADAYATPLTRDAIQEIRKLYGLDKPLLLNFDVKDRRRAVLHAWEEVSGLLDEIAVFEERRKAAGGADVQEKLACTLEELEEALGRKGRKLQDFGMRLVPYLAPLVLSMPDSGGGARKQALLRALHVGAGLSAAVSVEELSSWWAQNSVVFEQDALRGVLDDLKSCPESDAAAMLGRAREELGELLLPVLMKRLEHTEDLQDKRRLITYAAPYAGYTKELISASDDSRFNTALRFIDSWWDDDGLAFREIGAFERVLKTFTEAQYPIWLCRILCLDFGESYIDHEPVVEKVWKAFKVTFSFQMVVIFLMYMISVPIGILSAVRQDTFLDRLTTFVLFVLYSLPSFWVAYMLIYFLGEGRFAELFPVQGLNSDGAHALSFWPYLMDRLWHMCLPVACMTYGGLAVLSRYTRSGMLDVIRQDYIRTARAKGLSERVVIMKHAFRNGIIPVVTLIGGLLPALISGSVIIEYIFGIPGMGRLGFNAVYQRNYPVVMAITFFSAFLVLTGILLSDILYALVDPRIRYDERK